MKNKSINFIVPLVIYPFDVMVSLGQSDEELKNTISKYDIDWSDNMKVKGSGLFYMSDRNQSLIRMKCIPESDIDFGYLQHEIFHAVTFILYRIGMKLVLLKSDEAFAYLCQFLTVEIYGKLPHYKK